MLRNEEKKKEMSMESRGLYERRKYTFVSLENKYNNHTRK